MRININFPSINRIVKFFIFSDLLLWVGWGFIDPLFSVFVIKNIEGATLVSLGFLATVYWIVKGVCQIPISLFLDKTDGEKDDFYALILGLMVSGVSAFILMLVSSMWQVYLVQFLKAIGFALYIPAWTAIFSRHLDKDHTAFDWAMSSSTVSFGIGLAGAVGGSVASYFGFNFVFLMVGLMSLISAIVLLFVPDLILPKKTFQESKMLDHAQAGIK